VYVYPTDQAVETLDLVSQYISKSMIFVCWL